MKPTDSMQPDTALFLRHTRPPCNQCHSTGKIPAGYEDYNGALETSEGPETVTDFLSRVPYVHQDADCPHCEPKKVQVTAVNAGTFLMMLEYFGDTFYDMAPDERARLEARCRSMLNGLQLTGEAPEDVLEAYREFVAGFDE